MPNCLAAARTVARCSIMYWASMTARSSMFPFKLRHSPQFLLLHSMRGRGKNMSGSRLSVFDALLWPSQYRLCSRAALQAEGHAARRGMRRPAALRALAFSSGHQKCASQETQFPVAHTFFDVLKPGRPPVSPGLLDYKSCRCRSAASPDQSHLSPGRLRCLPRR